MPDKWPLANGNWSNAANWNDGTKPAAGDDVYADGRTVTIDETIDLGAGTLRTTQRSGGTIGGGFTLGIGFNITAASIIAGSTTCLTVANASGTNIVTANIVSGTLSGNVTVVSKSAAGTLNIIGNLTGGTSGSSSAVTMLAGLLSITGDVVGGASGAQSFGINHNGGTVIVVGNCTGGASTASHAIRYQGNITSPLTITGNVTGGAGYQSCGLGIGISSGTVVINGNVTGVSSGQGFGIVLETASATTSLTINGNVLASVQGGIYAVTGSGANVAHSCRITINGTITGAVSGANGIFSPVALVPLIVNGNLFSASNGVSAVVASRVLINPSGTLQHEYRVNNAGSAGVARSLYTGGVNLNQPATNNVRSGTVYGASNEFTGTCAVPPAGSTVFGVPVDNTVGTAAITEATIRAALGLASANLDTQLEALSEKSLDIQSSVSQKPTLAQIEASTVLAKQSTLVAVGDAVVAVGLSVDGKPTLVQIEGSTVLAKQNTLTTGVTDILNAVDGIEVDNIAIAEAVRIELTNELDIINNIPDSFDAISTQIDNIETVFYVSPAAFTSPGKVTGRSLRPYYKDTSRLGPIGIADSTRTPIDLSAFEGDLYVSVMDADTLEVLLYDDDPYFVTSNLYIDPSPESVGVLNAPLCWVLRRISNNQTLMEGPWEVQFAAYRTTA